MAQSSQLSKREREVVDLLLLGQSNKQIASSLSISERTVEFHLKNIYAKFGVSSRVELVLQLRDTVDQPEAEKPGFSTVDLAGESIENEDGPDLPKSWATPLKEAVSMIGKESGLNNFLNVQANDEAGNMSFLESIRVCLTKYAEFNGRATRPEFWWFALFVTLVAGALAYASEALSSIFLIAVLLPLLAVGARRLRDAGMNVWWLLIGLAPVGGLVILIWFWSLPTAEKSPVDELAA
jgi:DNA-binding CsgD family transcriptional regulator